MQFRFAPAAAALVAAALALPTGAAAHDMASYQALTPGNWSILQDSVTGEQFGYVTSSNAAGQVVQTWYRLRNGTWEFDSAEIFTVTARRITYVGSSDGTATWVFEPALSWARQQPLNGAVVYKGVQRNTTTNDTVPVTVMLSISAENLSAVTPAGTFSNCIKTRQTTYGGGTSRDSASINCPGRQEAMTWWQKIIDTASPTVEDQSEVHRALTIAGGTSNPPIP